MTFGSLFAGIGGFDLGLERAGMECRWQVEIDEYCQRVLAKHWPHVPKFGDIRSIEEGQLEPVDLICGGFPCQDISYAGKGAGIEGERSGLWKEMLRVIRMVRPRIVLVENVPALLGRGMGVVLGDLHESGFDAEWDCIPAAAVGAPHRRDRVWLVGYSHNEGKSVKSVNDEASAMSEMVAYADKQGLEGWEGPIRQEEGRFDNQRYFGAESCVYGRNGQWEVEPDVGRVADGISRRVHRLRALGNAVVPQVVEWIGRRILESDASRLRS